MSRWCTWKEATEAALYGPAGFFRRQAPADHFRTSAQIRRFAAAIGALADRHDLRRIVDVGAGRGELLRALAGGERTDRSLVGVELATRPVDLPPEIGWSDGLPLGGPMLVVANEWLDNVPVDVAEVDRHGAVRLVEVAVGTGAERLGPPIDRHDGEWLERWWPLAGRPPGTRAEVGWPRDAAWAGIVRKVASGVLVAIDYCHLAGDRPAGGTLTGYRDGREVAPVPDGSCDVTAHVAFDAVRAAGEAAGAVTMYGSTQAEALRSLGVDAGRPPLATAGSDPAGYLAALSEAGAASELLDPAGLGGFGWLQQTVTTDPSGPAPPKR